MKNNTINRLFIGFKKGFFTPTLPDKIIKIQSYPIIRFIRFLAGISLIFISANSHLNYNIYFLDISMFFV